MNVDHTRHSVGKVVGTQVRRVQVDMYLVCGRKGHLVVCGGVEVELARVYSRKMEL